MLSPTNWEYNSKKGTALNNLSQLFIHSSAMAPCPHSAWEFFPAPFVRKVHPTKVGEIRLLS